MQCLKVLNGTRYKATDDIDIFIDAIKDIEFKTITNNKKIKYYNIPCSFDIETTSYEFNQLDTVYKVGIMYLWSFAIYDICIYGRTWDGFLLLLDRLIEFLEINLDKRLIIFCHNLDFEFQFIRKRLVWEKIFATEERKVLYTLTLSGLEFRCSYKLSGYSLAKLSDQLTEHTITKLVGGLDYSLKRHYLTPITDTELEYSICDVLTVTAYIDEKIKRDGDITRLQLTKTGYVRQYCRKNCLKGSYYDWFNYTAIMNELQLEPEEYKQLKRAFQGGFTHASARYSRITVKDVDSIDFTSSYPYVMVAYKFPMSRGKRVEVNKDNFYEYIKNYCCVFDVKFTGLESKIYNENYISSSKCWHKSYKINEKGKKISTVIENNGRVSSADCIATTITDVDFRIIRKFYTWDKMEVANMIIYKRAYLPTLFVKSILKLYKDKTELKGVEGKEVEYLNGKENCNSSYGMTVQDVVREVISYIDDEWKTDDPDIETAIYKYNTSKKRFLFYAWGVFITAYARFNLLMNVLAFGDDYIYSDTDSIKCTNIEKHMDIINSYNNKVMDMLKKSSLYHKIPIEYYMPKTKKGIEKPLGVWEWETKEHKYKRFKTLGAKRYLVECEDALIDYTTDPPAHIFINS